MAEYVCPFLFLRLRATKERMSSLSPPISGDCVACRLLPLHMFVLWSSSWFWKILVSSVGSNLVGPTARPQTAATDLQDTMPVEVTSLPVPPEPEPSLSPEVSTNAKREKYQRKTPRLSETAELGEGEIPTETKIPKKPKKGAQPAQDKCCTTGLPEN